MVVGVANSRWEEDVQVTFVANQVHMVPGPNVSLYPLADLAG